MARRRLTKGQQQARQSRVNRVAAVLRRYSASPFEYEAACLYGLRSALCLEGWGWHQAHHEARQTVLAALDRIGARRPSWEQGQPEFVHRHIDGFERSACARCGRPLPPNHSLWCSSMCRQNAHQHKYRHKLQGDAWAMATARRSAWSTPWDDG